MILTFCQQATQHLRTVHPWAELSFGMMIGAILGGVIGGNVNINDAVSVGHHQRKVNFGNITLFSLIASITTAP